LEASGNLDFAGEAPRYFAAGALLADPDGVFNGRRTVWLNR
jgi:hypothetical protein